MQKHSHHFNFTPFQKYAIMITMFKSILKPKPFGLDISENSIKVVQLPSKFAQVELKYGIKAALKKAKIKSKYVIAALPENKSFVRLIPQDGNIKDEIQANVPFPIEKIYYDWEETEKGLFFIAATKKIVDHYVAFLKKADLIIQALEPETIAITRALVQSKNNLMIIDMGKSKTKFIIVSNKIIRFTAERNQLNLVEQIKEYLRFYQIDKILLCGGKSLKRNIDKNLEEKLKIKVQRAVPKISIKCVQSTMYTTAIGLALRKHETT